MKSPGASECALAVDVGGTKMAVGLVAGDGRLLWRQAAPTPASRSAEEVWDVLAGLIRSAGEQSPPATLCGVGCGGPMEAGGQRVSPLNIPAWRGFPLLDRVRRLTGLPVRVDNDAKALALAEGWLGAARGSGNYVAMVVSTGVGGGIVVDGRLLEGRSGNAGHIGHVVVVPDGRLCGCGARGCLEAEASGTAIAAITGKPPAEAGPEVVARAGRLVGRAVGSVANLLDLELAAVSGSVALGYGEPFFAAARRELQATARLEFSRLCRLEPSPLADRGPILGAAAVAWSGP